jgi:hypothetical protein
MDSTQAIAHTPAPPRYFMEILGCDICPLSVDGSRVPSFQRKKICFLKRLQAKKRRDAYEATDEFKKRSASSNKGVITKKRKELNARITFLETKRATLLSDRTVLATRLQQAFRISDVSRFTKIAEFDRMLVNNQQMITSAKNKLDRFNAEQSA